MADFECEHCHTRFELLPEDIGEYAICRTCGGKVVLLPDAERADAARTPSECAELTSQVHVDTPRWYQWTILQIAALTLVTAVAMVVTARFIDDQYGKFVAAGYSILLVGYLIVIMPGVKARRLAAKTRLARIEEYRRRLTKDE